MPILYTLYLSFTKWDGFDDPVFLGIANYERILQDSFFYQAIGNTLIIWLMSIIPQLTIALILAMILNESSFAASIFPRGLFLSHIITPVTLGVMFSLMFDWQTGSINKIIMAMGLVDDPVNWFNHPWLARMIVAGVICWQYFGYNMIVFIAGLQSIPSEVYEAAEVDGATKFKRRFVSRSRCCVRSFCSRLLRR